MLPDALVSASFAVVLEAVHRALRYLRFRDGAEHMLAQMRKETDDRASHIAVAVADAIEREEGKPIAALDDAAAARRIDELSKFVEARTKEQWPYREGAGEAALDVLRHKVM
jgi:hypothetical protein